MIYLHRKIQNISHSIKKKKSQNTSIDYIKISLIVFIVQYMHKHTKFLGLLGVYAAMDHQYSMASQKQIVVLKLHKRAKMILTFSFV